MKATRSKRKFPVLLISAVLLFLILSVAGFFFYVGDYYPAEEEALSYLEDSSRMEVRGNLTILYPEGPSETALIFYPGAKVEHFSYLPILDKLRNNGITCILVEMPFRMAIFDADAAADVFPQFPGIRHWYIGGHSMGGAMASSYASDNPDKVSGLILMGAYVYGTYPPEKALTVYGTFNANLEKSIDYTENIVILEGGNHAQFGNYGPQKGDPPATISSEVQQQLTVDAILDFIRS